jgi:hypothetical protein
VLYPADVGRRGALLSALGALLIALIAAPAASAASLLFTGDGDLFAATPDGATIRRVADVDPSAPLHQPSAAPDGTIWVLAGGLLVHLSSTGSVLASIAPAVGGPLVDLAVSPDGTKLAYVTADAAGVRTTSYTRADGTGGEAEYGSAIGLGGPSWLDATRVLLDNGVGGVAFDTVEPGATPASPWFTDAAGKPTDGAVNAGLTFGAWVGTDTDGSTLLGLYTLAGAPPAVPSRTCRFGSQGAGDPDWSPDGGTVAWADDRGIWVAPVPSLADCAALTANRITSDGAREPDWSPLDLVPGVPRVSADGKPRVVGLALAATAFPAATGTTLAFTATAPGLASATVQRVSQGVRKQRGCVAGRAKKKLQRCTFREVVGPPIEQAVAAGAVGMPIVRPDLTPGTYELVVSVTDVIGRHAAPKRIRFTVQ